MLKIRGGLVGKTSFAEGNTAARALTDLRAEQTHP